MQPIESESVNYQGETGTIEAHLAKPLSRSPRPGIIVIHEIFGLVDHTKDVANRIAAEGYVTLAPNLYSGSEALRSVLTPSNAGALMRFMQTIPPGKMRDPIIVQQELSKQPKGDQASLQKTMGLLLGDSPRIS